jgi:hypothetical protein
MICPVCNSEYREGFTRCADCGVNLVVASAKENEPDQQRTHEPAVVVWRGQDPVSFSTVTSALQSASIPFLEFHNRDLTASLSRPMALAYYGVGHSEVRVYPADLAAAQEIVLAALRPLELVRSADEPEEMEEASDVAVGAGELPPLVSTAPKKSIGAPVEIWRGEDAARARSLGKALGAEHIISWLLTTASGESRILVAKERASRAARIVKASRA